MLLLTNTSAFATLTWFILFRSVLGGVLEHGDSSNQHSSTKMTPTDLQKYKPNKNPGFKEPLPKAFDRSLSLQHSYAPKSEHLSILHQSVMTDHEQELAVSARQPHAEIPTKSSLPIHRQNSYKEAKDLEHAHNGIAKIYDHVVKQGGSTPKQKEVASMFGQQERVRAQSFNRKANEIVKNPNGRPTKWPKASGDTSWLKNRGKYEGA